MYQIMLNTLILNTNNVRVLVLKILHYNEFVTVLQNLIRSVILVIVMSNIVISQSSDHKQCP
jgi:hypothetical protein